MVASVFQAVGIDHLVTVDLHAPQIEGFFHVPVDSLDPVPVLCHAVEKNLADGAVVVSPDAGRVKMAARFARRLGSRVAVVHKERASGTETLVTHVVGDVRGRPCLLIDDMISTGGTLSGAIDALLAAGAREEMSVAVTHGLFLEGAAERLKGCPVREVWMTDTLEPPALLDFPLRVAPVGPLIAQAILRLTEGLEAP